MINNIMHPAKRPKYFFIMPLIMALYLIAGLANAQKPIKLNAKQLATFAGKYQCMNAYVTVVATHNGIIIQGFPGQRAAISFYPTDLHEFSTSQLGKPYWLIFSGPLNKKAPSFVTIDHDIWMRVK